MTTASPPSPKLEYQPKKKSDFDPDSFRMTVGEHLEDLRKRMLLGLVGFVVAMGVCLGFGTHFLTFFCRPLLEALKTEDLTTILTYATVTEPFMIYLKVSMIGGAVFAGPWIIYQLWLFVAAGLYPNERKMVTRYIPLSISLFIIGVVFVYLLVLPLTMTFFLKFASEIGLPAASISTNTVDVPLNLRAQIPVIDGMMAKPRDGDMWIDKGHRRLYVWFDGKERVVQLGNNNLLTPHLTIGEYIDLVITFMLTFGLAFQLPLVVLALVRIGVVEIDFLRKQRKMVYFVMAIVAAFVAPGDVVTSMLALLIPLMVLYEFGLWLADRQMKHAAAEADKE
jgi:sec-independent protein translocase protein TatC